MPGAYTAPLPSPQKSLVAQREEMTAFQDIPTRQFQ